MVEIIRNYSFNLIPTGKEDMHHFSQDNRFHYTEQCKSEVPISSRFLKDNFKSGDNFKNSSDSSLKSRKKKVVCKFFLRNACLKGDSCSFSHSIPSFSEKLARIEDTISHFQEKLWKPDQNFKEYFKCMTQSDSSFESRSIPPSCSMTTERKSNANSVFSPEVKSPQLSIDLMTETGFSPQYYSALSSEFNAPNFKSSIFPNSTFPDLLNHSYSALNQSDIFLPVKDFVPETDFITHSYATSNSEASRMFHFQSDPSQAINVSLYPTSNEGAVSLSRSGAPSEVNVWNTSYPTLNPNILHMPQSDAITASERSIWTHLYSKQNQEYVHIPHSSTVIASESSLENTLCSMPHTGMIPLPYSNSASVSKEILEDHSSLTSNARTGVLWSRSATDSNVSLWGYPFQTSNRDTTSLPNSDDIGNSEQSDLLETVSKPRIAYIDPINSDLREKIQAFRSTMAELNLINSNSNSETFIFDKYQSDATIIHSDFPDPKPDFSRLDSNFVPDLLKFADSETEQAACHTSELFSRFSLPHKGINEWVNEMKLDSVEQNATETPDWTDSNKLNTDTESMKKDQTIKSNEDVICELCCKNVLEKESSSIYKFGILPNCAHSFCFSCIKMWSRQSIYGFGSKENKVLRSCPKCQTPFDYFLPSAYWINSKEEKLKLISDHLKALKEIPCTFFLSGICRFGDRCRFLHDSSLPERQSRRISTDSSGYSSETGSILNESFANESDS